MEKPTGISKLIKSVECSVCLEQLHNPKTLLCHHSFCKECLEDMLKFNEDGSATIQCPLCKSDTLIEGDKTVDSLAANYHLQDMLDFIHASTASASSCDRDLICPEKSCQNPISKWCVSCSTGTCENCWELHSNRHLQQHKEYTAVLFDKKTESLMPLCSKHHIVANFVCIQCDNKMICLYCKERLHKHHDSVTIHQSALLIQNWIEQQRKKMKEHDCIIEALNDKYAESLSEVKTCREVLTKELENRKVKCLAAYLQMLTNKQNKLLQEFDIAVNTFKERVTVGIAEKGDTSCFDQVMRKNDFQLVAERRVIRDQINISMLSSSALNMPKLTVTLIDNDSNASAHDTPLGYLVLLEKEMYQSSMSVEDVKNDHIRGFEYHTGSTEMNGISSKTIKYLKNVLSECVETKLKGNEQMDMYCSTLRPNAREFVMLQNDHMMASNSGYAELKHGSQTDFPLGSGYSNSKDAVVCSNNTSESVTTSIGNASTKRDTLNCNVADSLAAAGETLAGSEEPSASTSTVLGSNIEIPSSVSGNTNNTSNNNDYAGDDGDDDFDPYDYYYGDLDDYGDSDDHYDFYDDYGGYES